VTSTPTTALPTTTIARGHNTSTETLFGIRTESVASTSAVVVVLLLAAVVAVAVWRRWTLLGVAVMAGVLALLDVREALHQHDEGRASLVVAAVTLALAHLTASALGVGAYRQHD
jgi:hypothetical protein